MIKSFSYVASILFLMGAFLFCPKTDKKLSLLQWGSLALFGYELFACFVGAVLTILHIPAGIAYLAIVNVVVSFLLLYGVFKQKRIQQYMISHWEILGVLLLAYVTFVLGWHRFDGFTTINYETSDPAVHMRMAMDCLNNRSVVSNEGAMAFSQFTNALWIELFRPIYSGAFSFVPFILKDVYNLFLGCLVFYATFRPANERKVCWQVYIVTLAYCAGYPVSNLLFGFQYLGLGITAFCYLILCANIYHEKIIHSIWLIPLMNLGCLGSSLSYTLFAPVVYIGLFLFLTWDYFQGNRFQLSLSHYWNIVKLHLSVFLIPTFLTVYFIIIIQLFSMTALGMSDIFMLEGYVYRNLYSDYLIILPFAIYGWWNSIKEHNSNVLTFILPLQLIYSGYYFWKMLNGEAMTYYYYKFNYFNALLLFGLGAYGIVALSKKALAIVNSYIFVWTLVFSLWNTDAVYKIHNENISFAPFVDEVAHFRIYDTNKFYLSHCTSVHDWIVLSDALIDLRGKDNRTNLFIGDWLSSFWYEALADEIIEPNYAHALGPATILDLFMNDNAFGDYMVVISDSEEEKAVIDQLAQFDVVFKCDYGYIITRK